MFANLTAKFRAPSPREIARRELVEALRDQLVAETQLDYARQMVEYQKARVRRLKAALAGEDL